MTYVPPPPPEPLRPLDLAQRKDIGPLITSAWRVWRARPEVFLLTAMAVAVVPIAAARILSLFVVDDFMQRATDALSQATEQSGDSLPSDWLPGIEWSDAAWPIVVSVFEMLVVGLFVPALVTAIHARAVTALAEGEDVEAGEALRRGLAVFPSVLWSLLIYGVAVLIGVVLLLVPGIWLSIAGVFTTTVVALSIGRGFGALRESLRVVRRAGWWRTFGAVFVVALVGYALAFIPLAVIGAVIGSEGTADGVKIGGAIIEAIIQAALMSWSALAITLLFFSAKARIGEPWIAPPGTTPIDVPGGSGVAAAGPQTWAPPQQGGWQQPQQGGWQQPPQGWTPPPGQQSQQGWGQQAPPQGWGQQQDKPIFHKPGQVPQGWQAPPQQQGWGQQQPPNPPQQPWGQQQPPPGDQPPSGELGGEQPPRFLPPGQRPPEPPDDDR